MRQIEANKTLSLHNDNGVNILSYKQIIKNLGESGRHFNFILYIIFRVKRNAENLILLWVKSHAFNLDRTEA